LVPAVPEKQVGVAVSDCDSINWLLRRYQGEEQKAQRPKSVTKLKIESRPRQGVLIEGEHKTNHNPVRGIGN